MVAFNPNRVIALDPGNATTGVVVYNPLSRQIVASGVRDNEIVRLWLARDDRANYLGVDFEEGDRLAIEMIASYGMAVGREVFDTCVWIGRFLEAWGGEYRLVYRRDVKLHLCESVRATDANVRQALIDRYGGKDKAVGRKASPGPLYGVKSHCWPALAVAITYAETPSIGASSYPPPVETRDA